MNMLRRFLDRRPVAELELELDTRLAARALARRRVTLEREPIKARARQLCAELGKPVPPVLQERRR